MGSAGQGALQRPQPERLQAIDGLSLSRRVLDSPYSAPMVRSIVLPMTGAASLLLSRVVVQKCGIEVYATVTLITSLPAMLPVNDLGLGAALTNAAGSLSSDPGRLLGLWRRSQLLLL